MLELILVRHGETELNRHGRYQGGGSDAPLTEAGVAQAQALRSHLSALVDERTSIWTSDLQRARRTAELALPGHRARQDIRLRELAFGEFEGLSYEENLEKHGERFSRWLLDPWNVAPPGGETLDDLLQRVDGWLSDAARDGDRALAVAHGGSIQMIVALYLGLPFDWTWRLSLPPAEVLRLAPGPTYGNTERLNVRTGSFDPIDLQPESLHEP